MSKLGIRESEIIRNSSKEVLKKPSVSMPQSEMVSKRILSPKEQAKIMLKLKEKVVQQTQLNDLTMTPIQHVQESVLMN